MSAQRKPDLLEPLTAGAAGDAAHRSAAPVTGPLSGHERDARHLVSVDHPERSSSFDTIPVAPVYLRVDPVAEPGREREHLPLIALDGGATPVARFRHLADLAHWLRRDGDTTTLPLPIAAAARRLGVGQRDLLLDPQFPLVPDDLAERVQRWAREMFRRTACCAGDGHAIVRGLREIGIGLVDAARHRFLIDETIYSGAQFRSRRHLARAERAEGWLAHRQPPAGVWAGLLIDRSPS